MILMANEIYVITEFKRIYELYSMWTFENWCFLLLVCGLWGDEIFDIHQIESLIILGVFCFYQWETQKNDKHARSYSDNRKMMFLNFSSLSIDNSLVSN